MKRLRTDEQTGLLSHFYDNSEDKDFLSLYKIFLNKRLVDTAVKYFLLQIRN